MGKINVFKACLLGGLAIAGMPVLAQQSQAPGTNDLVNETRTITIKAQVTNTKGETLPGVHVKVKGSNLGTITDINGNFKLNLPAGHLLVFSYVGYESVETPTDELSDKVVLEENTQSLQEVVVTTQKRQQSSIEIPTAVSALSGKDMAQLNLTQMNQVADFIPGVQIQQQSPNNGGYAIRGVTSDDGAATSQPRVSVFIDGVSNFRTQSSQVELFDMDRVEVVKGPQGTLFGRGAEIGAVNLIRKKPVNYLTGELSLNYGSYNQHGANGFINTPILNDKLLNRLAFSYDTHDGFIKNLSGGRLNGKEAFAIRNSTRLFTGENTTIDVVLDYQHDNYPGTSFKSNRFTPEGDENFDANRPANLEEGNWLGIKRHTGGALFAVNHNLSSAWMLTSTSGFRAYKSDENFDADGTYLPLLKCTENSKGLQFSQEFRMNYNNGGPLTGFFGTSYFYEKVQQGATLQGNMQHLYPAYISSSLKEQFNGIAHTIEGIDFTQISTGNPAIDQLLPVLNQLKPTIVNTLNQYINQSWFPESSTDASQAVSQLPNIWGDLDNTVKGLTQQLVGLPISLDTLLGMVGDAIPTEYQQQLNLIKNISNAPLDSDMHHEDMTNYAENQSVDVFADGTWHIWKGLSATLGIRGTYEHQRSGYSSNSSLTDNPFGMAFLYQPSENGEKVWASKDYFSYVGRFALNYMFERNNVYFNLSRGRRPGVIAFNNNPNDIEKLRPETIWSYEAGIKGNIQTNYSMISACTTTIGTTSNPPRWKTTESAK